MNAPPRSPEADPDLVQPGAQSLVQDWVAAPANSLDAPTVARARSGATQVIYAEHKPRLSGPELLARYGRVEAASLSGARVRPVEAEPRASSALRRSVGQLRPAWWGALIVVAAVLSTGATPI